MMLDGRRCDRYVSGLRQAFARFGAASEFFQLVGYLFSGNDDDRQLFPMR